MNFNLLESSFLLNTVHIKVASSGVISVLISWPWRHKPASSLKESLDPKPAHYKVGFFNNLSVILTICEPVPAISNPSSPV
jgi:hypothetical protein